MKKGLIIIISVIISLSFFMLIGYVIYDSILLYDNNDVPYLYNPRSVDCKFMSIDTIGCNIDVNYKYVGGILGDDGKIYCIPTGASSIMEIDTKTKKLSFWGNLDSANFKYTGGGYSEGIVYGFPRKSDKFLKIDTKTHSVSEEPFYRITPHIHALYGEHHYGGILINDKIFCCPRERNTILIINTKTHLAHEIRTPLGVRYSSVCYHPNGNLYFTPERNPGGKVMKLDLKTYNLSYIGNPIECSCFGLVVHPQDSNIYSYSAYTNGILKIDVKKDNVEMIHKDIGTGWFGTKLGPNGLLYSVCGDNTNIMEFDPISDSVRCVAKLDSALIVEKANCAGGSPGYENSIYVTPAMGSYIYMI